jgi:5'-nucleotidase
MTKILLTNDDGWDAPGIAALKVVLAEFGQVVVVAPAKPQSGISHQMTFETPMALTEHSTHHWHVDGTPADCARVGLTQLQLDFDWVFSGINNGGNLGVDFFISGTVAAAREATYFGAKAIAISQHRLNYPQPFDWDKSKAIARRVIADLMGRADFGAGQLANVNLPDCSNRDIETVSIVQCQRDTNPLPFEYRDATQEEITGANKIDQPNDSQSKRNRSLVYCGTYNSRKRDPGKDIDVCLGGNIAVTWN